MSAQALKGINLLPKDSFEGSGLGRFLQWSLSAGRAIVVLTELVVILAFGSRFWFDKTLNDLVEVIDQKQALVRSYREVENQMREVLAREAPVAIYLEKNLEIDKVMADLIKATPVDIVYEQMSIAKTGLAVKGKAQSEMSLAGLIANLSQIERVKELAIGETKFSQRDGRVEFELTASFKNTETKK